MFERYTGPARRVMFLARYEAVCLASSHIEPEHLFLGLARENGPLLLRCGLSAGSQESIRKQIESQSRAAQGERTVSVSIDLQLGDDSKRALACGAEESRSTNDKDIRPEHLLLGLLSLKDSALVQLLREHSLTYDSVQKRCSSGSADPPEAPSLARAVTRLRHILAVRVRELDDVGEAASAVPMRDAGWSRKQILGHLIDSASNNHQRFVRALIQPELEWPSYEQQGWVSVQRYSLIEWETLVSLWVSYNRHLLWIILHIPEEKVTTNCRIGAAQRITLGELIGSYVDHLEHHLEQI